MKNNNRVTPVGLKGNQINERMMELMGITPINENKSTSVVELTKKGPDGNIYAIVRENHAYYIKIASKKENLVAEDFKYVGGLQNKKSEVYPSYAKAIKHLNLKFNSLKEAFNSDGDFNVFENDNLVTETNASAAGFSEMKGNGFSGEGNLEGNKPLNTEAEEKEEELTTEEKAVDDMVKEDSEEKKDDKKDVKENRKLSIVRALEQMDAIIDTLAEGKVKKKVYTIK